MRPTALPRELIRCWEETIKDANGKTRIEKMSLMLPCEIAQFRTRFFCKCMDMYNNWKIFKQSPPMGQGWGNERNVTCRILRILADEDNLYEQWKRDLEEKKRKG